MPDKSYKKRIAIINQRYGKEINGGSEYFTRQLAQHLSFDYKIQILTTCAKNYTTWKKLQKQSIQWDAGRLLSKVDTHQGMQWMSCLTAKRSGILTLPGLIRRIRMGQAARFPLPLLHSLQGAWVYGRQYKMQRIM